MKPTKQNRVLKAKGFSLIELLIVVAIILLIAAIGIPSLLRARISANEAAAVSAIRNVRNGEATYVITYSDIGFANALFKLGPGVPCDQNGACLIDPVIGCASEPCPKSGFNFFLTSGSAAAPFTDFTATATPIGFGGSGAHNYCTLDDGILRTQKTPTASLSAAVTRAQCSDPTNYVPIQ
jgi:prepilin-type N-terminal cleavage/methylation domain-containing protein